MADQSVGLCFIILPCLFLLIIYFAMRFKECGDDCVDCEECTTFVVAVHFFPLFQLKMYDFLVTLKSRTSVAARHSNVSGESIVEWSTVVL